MEIKEIEWGFCYHYGDYIEVNKNLKNYPKLYEFTMEHELKHEQVRGFDIKDLLWDIEEAFRWKNIKMVLKIWVFMLKYPKSLVQLIPFWIKDKKLVVDINRIIVYAIFTIFIISLTYMWRMVWF